MSENIFGITTRFKQRETVVLMDNKKIKLDTSVAPVRHVACAYGSARAFVRVYGHAIKLPVLI